MKTIFVLSVIFIFILSACSTPYEPDQPRKDVAEYFKSGAEPTAKDAIWTKNSIFKVGVISDDTRRDGYAMYVCEVLRDRGLASGTWVQIIDIVKLTKTGSWDVLGEARCK